MPGGTAPSPRAPTALTVVVPAYNEAESLPAFVEALRAALKETAPRWTLIVVDDGSTDGTFEVLRRLAEGAPEIQGVRLSCNRGQQTALRCGLERADGDVVVSMDADLQHPPGLIPEMIARWAEGYDIVSMITLENPGRGTLRTVFVRLFYAVFNTLSEVPLTPGESDFRLLDRQCVLALRQFRDQRWFVRGFVRSLGFDRVEVPFNAPRRVAGESSYTMARLVELSTRGFYAFGGRLLYLGLALAAVTGGMLLMLGAGLATGMLPDAPDGWVLPALVLGVGAAVLLTLGVLGAFFRGALDDLRGRPPYHVAERLNRED